MVETLPYGSWPSPLGAERLAESVVVFQGVALDGDDVWWLELRPSEGGRNVLVRNGEDVTPEGFDVRTMAHEYGGGAFVVRDGTVWFSNFTDQRLYRQEDGAAPEPVTPETSAPRADRYADADLSPDGKHLYCVRERHGSEGEPANSIVRIPADGSGEPLELWSGSDFVSNPRLSPDGAQLAWLAWDHPNMPWDTTELHVAKVTKKGLGKDRVVLGGGEASAFQPAWSPDGVLHAVADPEGWWNLYRLDGDEPVCLHRSDQEFGTPQWLFGLATYAFLDDGTIVCIVGERGEQHLRLLHPGGGLEDTRLPWRTYLPYAFTSDGRRVAFAAAGPTAAPTIVAWTPGTDEHTEHARAFDLDLDQAFVSVPEPITFPTEQGEAHALFYPPTNPEARGADGELPPLLVNIHGGPTSATDSALRLSIQYWTTRGFAFCDLNYRGSTGYGREYRDALKGKWGVADVEDAAAVVRYLAAQGKVDGDRTAIRGGSAGGWTTLCALAFDGTFATGVSHFGVTDLRPFVTDTHKFEARYLDSLVGPWPESEALYVERSPAEHADRIDRPVLLLQGLEDAVVPPSQAEKMVAALEASGTPHAYITFEGEQHGWRQASTIIRAHEAELAFYGEVFGFSPADDVEPVELR